MNVKRLLPLLVVSTLLVPGCNQKSEGVQASALPGAAANNVKIGFINSITGAEAPIGENLTNGVTLALEDLQARNINVELIREDDTGKPEKAMAAFEQLLED